MNAHSEAVDVFAVRARAFVAWCNSDHAGKNAAQIQRESLAQLSRLYAAALDLPDVDFVPAPDPPEHSQQARERLAANLRPLPFQYYWEVFTPTDHADQTPACGDLFDDFLDIVGDLSDGLWLYDAEHHAAAAFAWAQMFDAHWGRHAVSAMRALHTFDPLDSWIVL